MLLSVDCNSLLWSALREITCTELDAILASIDEKKQHLCIKICRLAANADQQNIGGIGVGYNWNDFIAPLYTKEYKRLIGIAYRKTKDWALAQDLVHDTFLLAIFHKKKMIQHPKPEAWLAQTLQNLIKNGLRASVRQDIPLDEAIDVPAQAVDESLNQLLPVQLQDKEKEILIWRFEENMSYSEMSKRLDISEELCRKRVSQAVIKCRELFREKPVH